MKRLIPSCLLILLPFFYSCQSTDPLFIETDNPSAAEPQGSFSLMPLSISSHSAHPPIEEIAASIFSSGEAQPGVQSDLPYWAMDDSQLKTLGSGSYPRIFPDFYAVGDFWYLLITRQQEEAAPLTREVYHLGYQPWNEPLQWTPESYQIPQGDDKLPLIVIDPGHGGRDSGAVATNNLGEKTYNQRLALDLKEELDALGFTVVFTYDPEEDQSRSLEERWRFSGYYGRAIFVSLHHNSSNSPDDRGFSLFFSSHSNIEESPSAYVTIDGEEKPFVDQEITSRHVNLHYMDGDEPSSRRFNRRDSHADYYVRSRQPGELALHSFELSLDLYTQLRTLDFLEPYFYSQRMIDERDYQVLVNNPNRSVIIEAGFLSNAEEAELLKLEENRRAVAEAIARGIEVYSSKGMDADLSLK